MKTRIQYIDRLKGLAILSVVLGHCYLFALNHRGVIFGIVSSYEIPLFIFLSGYVLTDVPNFAKMLRKVSTF